MDNTDGVVRQQVGPGVWVVSLRGEQDLAGSAEVRAAFASVRDSGDVLVADLSAVTFIDSAAIGELVRAHDAANGRFLIVAPDGHPRRILRMTLDGVIDVHDDLPAAVAAAGVLRAGSIDGHGSSAVDGADGFATG